MFSDKWDGNFLLHDVFVFLSWYKSKQDQELILLFPDDILYMQQFSQIFDFVENI